MRKDRFYYWAQKDSTSSSRHETPGLLTTFCILHTLHLGTQSPPYGTTEHICGCRTPPQVRVPLFEKIDPILYGKSKKSTHEHKLDENSHIPYPDTLPTISIRLARVQRMQ